MELSRLQVDTLRGLKTLLKENQKAHPSISVHTICMMYVEPVPSYPQVAAALGVLYKKGLLEKRSSLKMPFRFKGAYSSTYYPTPAGTELIRHLTAL